MAAMNGGAGLRRWRAHLCIPVSWTPAARRWALTVIGVGGALDVLLLSRARWSWPELVLFTALMGCGTVVSVVQRWFGAPTKGPAEASVDLQSVWIFAVTLLLPPVYAAMAPLALEWSSTPSSRNPGLVNRLLNVSNLGMAGAAASAVASHVGGAARPPFSDASTLGLIPEWRLLTGVCLAIVVFTLLNAATIGEMIHRHHGVSRLSALGGWAGVVVEVAVQCTGALLAAIWALSRPLGILSLPPLMLLQRSLLHSQLLAAARTDAKTGLVNSTYWRQLLEIHLRRAAAATEPLTVALIDLDHFKQVNDEHGHLVGDDALVATAHALTEVSRPGDVVGRFGGEEFAVLLPGLSTSEASVVAERLRRAIADVRISGDSGPRITASVGIATLDEHGNDVDELLGAADRALYAAKTDGRNRVRVALAPTGQAEPSQPVVERALA